MTHASRLPADWQVSIFKPVRPTAICSSHEKLVVRESTASHRRL